MNIKKIIEQSRIRVRAFNIKVDNFVRPEWREANRTDREKRFSEYFKWLKGE